MKLHINKKEKFILATVFAVAFFFPYGVVARIAFVAIMLLILSVIKIAIDIY